MEMKLDIRIIKEERKKRAWTQQHLADVTDLSLRTIQRIESSSIGGAESIKSIASVFNIEIDELLVKTEQKEDELGNFSGGLQFFKILNIGWFLLSTLSLISLITLPIFNPNKAFFIFENSFIFLELLPGLIFPCLILKLLENQEIKSPNKIKSLIVWELVTKFVVFIMIVSIYSSEIVEKSFPLLFSAFYSVLWMQYFKHSKRVFSYYGSNAL